MDTDKKYKVKVFPKGEKVEVLEKIVVPTEYDNVVKVHDVGKIIKLSELGFAYFGNFDHEQEIELERKYLRI